MNQLLIYFFSVNKKISIRGVGTFISERGNAEDDFGSKSIWPSMDNIVFQSEIDEKTIEQFEHFAEHKSKKSTADVAAYFQQLANKWNNENRLNIDGLGILTRKDNNITFEQSFSSKQFFPPVAAEKVIRHDAEHTVRVGEDERTSTQMREALSRKDSKKYWWVYVLIALLVAGASYGFYYFYFLKR